MVATAGEPRSPALPVDDTPDLLEQLAAALAAPSSERQALTGRLGDGAELGFLDAGVDSAVSLRVRRSLGRILAGVDTGS
jgi:hypothetical protein